MSIFLLLLSVGVQSPDLDDPDRYAPPELRKAPDCICATAQERPDVTFSGYVIDAQVTLGGDRRSVDDRMATIFDVRSASDADVEGRTRLWHDVSPKQCGLTFDYGKSYSVAARWGDNGELETDKCLMRAAR